MYMDNYQTGKWRHVLHKGNEDVSTAQPGIFLHPDTNNMVIKFETLRSKFEFIPNQTFDSLLGHGSTINEKASKPIQVFIDSSVKEKYQHHLDNNFGNTQVGHFKLRDVKDWCRNADGCVGFYGVLDARNGSGVDVNDHNSPIQYAVVPKSEDEYMLESVEGEDEEDVTVADSSNALETLSM